MDREGRVALTALATTTTPLPAGNQLPLPSSTPPLDFRVVRFLPLSLCAPAPPPPPRSWQPYLSNTYRSGLRLWCFKQTTPQPSTSLHLSPPNTQLPPPAPLIQSPPQFQGRAVLAFELVRPSPATTSPQLAALAKQYVSLGAEALVVRTDSEDSPEGLKDLWAVVQAVKVPVLARDFLIHPLQVRGGGGKGGGQAGKEH